MDTHTSNPNIELARAHQPDAPDAQYEVACEENTSSLQPKEPPTSQNQSPLSIKKPRRRPTPRALLYPHLEIETILAWADAHHQRTCAWPMGHSGEIQDAPGETWTAVEMALAHGQRGLPGGSSLALLLKATRGRPHPGHRPRLTLARILAWADAHHECTGSWPNLNSGAICGVAGENWSAIQGALDKGQRGLPGGSSLAQLLDDQRGVRNRMRLPALTVQQILTWADAHHTRTGRWPTRDSGTVEDAPLERWSMLNTSLILGNRTLRGGSSLAQLLLEERDVRHHLARPPLSEAQIMIWAQNFQARHSHPPRVSSGAVTEAPEETWSNLDNLLRQGQRGLKGGSSLHQLLLYTHPEWFTPLKSQTSEE